MKADSELAPFARLIEALEPWLDKVVVIGGWAHRLYRLDPRARALEYPPLATLDSDVAVPLRIAVKEANIRERLLAGGFEEEFVGEHKPPATHYHLGKMGGFYAEFLTPLVGSEHDRKGERRATLEVGGIFSQRLRYVDILLLYPWSVRLDKAAGYPFVPAKRVQIANPVTFLTQKILIHNVRDRRDRAKDALYIHDTIETFSANLTELREIFSSKIRPKLHANQLAEVRNVSDGLFGSMNDTIREAVLVAKRRGLTAEALIDTCQAGLRAVFI
jgi:Nucleotidyltransferase